MRQRKFGKSSEKMNFSIFLKVILAGETIWAAIACPTCWKLFAHWIGTEISAVWSIDHKIWGKENLENRRKKCQFRKFRKISNLPKVVKSALFWPGIAHWSSSHSMRVLKNQSEKFLGKNWISAIFSWSIFSIFLQVILGWGKFGQRFPTQPSGNFLLIPLGPELVLYHQ